MTRLDHPARHPQGTGKPAPAPASTDRDAAPEPGYPASVMGEPDDGRYSAVMGRPDRSRPAPRRRGRAPSRAADDQPQD